MKTTQRGFVGLPILIVILLGIVVLGGGAYFIVYQQSPSQTVSSIPYSQSDVAKQASLKEARGNISRVIYMELTLTRATEKLMGYGGQNKRRVFQMIECVADKFAFSVPADIAEGLRLI